jgi:2,3-bisphosphoglycerate-independent phosphoglycerate mutase
MSQKTMLMILDGWGMTGEASISAVAAANTPFMDSLPSKYPNATLRTSGMDVGLPDGQMGNSEVGHMNLGAGRVVYQDLVKLNLASEDGSLAKEPVLIRAMEHAKKNNKKFHLMGLVSDGGVHAHIRHLKALLSAASDFGLDNVYVHAFTDGRDTDPKAGAAYIEDLENHINKTTGSIASVIGRYYAMDRDRRWERVKLAYDLLVNAQGEPYASAKEAIEHSYADGVTDEFIKPKIIRSEGVIEEGDVVLCFNFRTDRGRQITMALTQQDFPDYEMHKLDLYYVTMTRYDEEF